MSGIIPCAQCAAPQAQSDDYCGFCGAPLRVLHLTPARIVLKEDGTQATARIENRGIFPASFALRSSDARKAPPWLVSITDVDVSQTLLRQSALDLTLHFAPEALPSGGARGQERNIGHHVVEFITDSLAWDPVSEHAHRKILRLELAAQSKPRVHPEVVAYRFLPLERVSAGNVQKHTFEIVNEGGHATELIAIHVSDAPVHPEQTQRIPAAKIVSVKALGRAHTLGPGGNFSCEVTLRADDSLLHKKGAHFFAADVLFEFRGQSPIKAQLYGLVGLAPRLVHSKSLENIVRAAGGPAPGRVRLRNQGAAPLRLLGAQVLTEALTPAPKFDWLDLDDTGSGTLLDGASEHTLELWVDPAVREKSALDVPWDKRIIRVFHDGESATRDAEGRAYLDTPLSAELGTIRDLKGATVGVDFGTSNSSVCLLHGQSGKAHGLFLDADAQNEALASLLFYLGERTDSPQPFLFGQAAENASSLNYANLVRSIKSVIARDPATAYHFVETAQGGARQLATYSSQSLLETFLSELKRRAEAGVRRLPVPLLQSLDLLDTGVRFDKAVFTHPVGADERTLRSLYEAVCAAGFFDDAVSFEAFQRDSLLDEALAAVVAFVYTAALLPPDFLLHDEENILCVDVGGGTTDLAAVKVKHLAGFRAGQKTRVDLERLASGGDARMGGDDLDRLLGECLVHKVQEHKDATSFDTASVLDAMRFPSFETYRRSALERARTHHAELGEKSELARQVYGKASDLLRLAERAKRTLTQEDRVVVRPPTDDWPLKGRQQAPAGLRLELELTRSEARELYAPLFAECAKSVHDVLRDAGWSGDDVTCVLFTGQGSRVPELREAVVNEIKAHRQKEDLRVIEPDALSGFDCKRCVSMGAAIFGDSQEGGGGWLHLAKEQNARVPFSLQSRLGPRFVDVPGLAAGTAFPAEGKHVFAVPARVLTLYRSRELFVTFTFDEPVNEVWVIMQGPGDIFAQAGDVRVQGVLA